MSGWDIGCEIQSIARGRQPQGQPLTQQGLGAPDSCEKPVFLSDEDKLEKFGLFSLEKAQGRPYKTFQGAQRGILDNDVQDKALSSLV